MNQRSGSGGNEKIAAFREGTPGRYYFPIHVDGAPSLPQIGVSLSVNGWRGDKRCYVNVITVEKGHALFRAHRAVVDKNREKNEGIYVRFPVKKGGQSKHASPEKRSFLKELSRYLRAVCRGEDVSNWLEVVPSSGNSSRRDPTRQASGISLRPQARMAPQR